MFCETGEPGSLVIGQSPKRVLSDAERELPDDDEDDEWDDEDDPFEGIF
jgi:hypothetical protein